MSPWYCCIVVSCPVSMAPESSASEWPMCLAMWTTQVCANTMPMSNSPHEFLWMKKGSMRNWFGRNGGLCPHLASVSPCKRNICTATAWCVESMWCSILCSVRLQCSWISDCPILARQASSGTDVPTVQCTLAIFLWIATESDKNNSRQLCMVWDRCHWSALRHSLWVVKHPDPI